jgi:hypothetical protein
MPEVALNSLALNCAGVETACDLSKALAQHLGVTLEEPKYGADNVLESGKSAQDLQVAKLLSSLYRRILVIRDGFAAAEEAYSQGQDDLGRKLYDVASEATRTTVPTMELLATHLGISLDAQGEASEPTAPALRVVKDTAPVGSKD